MSLFLFFKNVYGLRVYGYTAAAKSATALQERTLAGRVFHSAGPRKKGRRVPGQRKNEPGVGLMASWGRGCGRQLL